MSTSTDRMRRLRERRAAGLVPIDGPSPLPPDEQLRPAVAEAIAALQLAGSDRAVAQLALSLADVIDRAPDQAGALRHLGPQLLRVLESMMATPASRPQRRRPGLERPNQVQRLRAAHAQHPAVRKRSS